MPPPAPHHFSKGTAWLCAALAGCICLSLAATPIVRQWKSDAWGYALILVNSILGIAIARSMDHRSLMASILGGAAGCAIVTGVLAFLQPLFIPPEPGTVYKFGGGMGSAIGGLALCLILGGLSGSVVGLIAGLLRRIP